jgi:hypothetical protein
MTSRLGRPARIAIGLAAVLAGCERGTPPLPPACILSAAAFERALSAAPRPVRLAGGTAISTCVDRARTAADLQNLGTLMSAAADDLATRAADRPAVALELGYLVGATRRGARHTNGVAGQLQQRIEAAAALRAAHPGTAALAALHQGIAAGQSSG